MQMNSPTHYPCAPIMATFYDIHAPCDRLFADTDVDFDSKYSDPNPELLAEANVSVYIHDGHAVAQSSTEVLTTGAFYDFVDQHEEFFLEVAKKVETHMTMPGCMMGKMVELPEDITFLIYGKWTVLPVSLNALGCQHFVASGIRATNGVEAHVDGGYVFNTFLISDMEKVDTISFVFVRPETGARDVLA